MFPTLLLVTFVVALAVSIGMALVFARPIKGILNRIIADEISVAWFRYLNFAILVVGVSAGVRIYDLEKYITPLRGDKDPKIIELTSDRWLLELYRTVIETLQRWPARCMPRRFRTRCARRLRARVLVPATPR
jgi:hypothetical protein